MAQPSGLLAKLFENRYNFIAPDSGPHKLPYTCSFHWFHTDDGRLIGVDVVRSDDMGRRALRVFVSSPGRGIDSFILEGPSSDWAPFATDAPPDFNQPTPVLGRGENWIAASASVNRQPVNSVSFLLNLKVLVPGKGTGEAGLLLANMTAMDFLRMEISGWIKINGNLTNLNSVIGYASMHFGDFLPNYAGVATVPSQNTSGNGILVNVTDADDIKHGASLLGGKSLVYGYGAGQLPGFFVTMGQLQKGTVPLQHGARLQLANIDAFPHVLLDRPTTTAVADATYVPAAGAAIPVGQVILDFRGPEYAPLLAP